MGGMQDRWGMAGGMQYSTREMQDRWEARLKDARGSNLVACKPSQTRGDFFGESDPEIKPVLLY